MILRCGRCRQDIASFEPKDLEKPLKAEMFKPLASHRGYEPFRAGQEWPFLLCRYCRMSITMDPSRPGEHPDFVMTPNGRHVFVNQTAGKRQAEIDAAWAEIEEECEDGPEKEKFICPNCKKEFKTKGALGNHKRFCKEIPK